VNQGAKLYVIMLFISQSQKLFNPAFKLLRALQR